VFEIMGSSSPSVELPPRRPPPQGRSTRPGRTRNPGGGAPTLARRGRFGADTGHERRTRPAGHPHPPPPTTHLPHPPPPPPPLPYSCVVHVAAGTAHLLISPGPCCHRDPAELQNHESGQDQLVIYMLNCPEYFETMLGAYLARVAPFNINYRYVEDELLYLLT